VTDQGGNPLLNRPRPLVIGVGNRHRRDDAVGLVTAEHLAPRLGERARVVSFEEESTGLLDLWEGVPLVVVVDALPSRGAPGRIHRFADHLAEALSEPSVTSTHALSLGEVWRLGESLGRLPGRLVVFGVEGAAFEPGIGLSPAVAESVRPVTEAVEAEILRFSHPERAVPAELSADA
jgi:hydrogenase maturation protease